MEGRKSMSNLKPTLSERNPYKLNKHRYYELKHFCLQYPEWKKEYLSLDGYSKYNLNNLVSSKKFVGRSSSTEECVIKRERYLRKMEMVEQSCIYADPDLKDYLLEAVTKDLSYTYLSTVLDMPCARDMYYNRYRKFFWTLDKLRD